MRITGSAAFAAVLLWSVAAAAQGPGGRPPGGFPGPGPGFGRGINVLGVEPLELANPIAGAPYSADTVTELVQQLPDGNRI